MKANNMARLSIVVYTTTHGVVSVERFFPEIDGQTAESLQKALDETVPGLIRAHGEYS